MVQSRDSGQIESDARDIRNACKSLHKNVDYRLGDSALLVFTDSMGNTVCACHVTAMAACPERSAF